MNMMEFTAEMIAGFLGGDVDGDKNATVHTVSSIEEGKAGSLAYLTNPKYEPFLYTTGASIVLVDRSFTPSQPVAATLVRVDDAGACVVKLLEMYNAAKPRRKGISQRASVAEQAVLGEDCYVGDFAVIEEGVRIGRNCWLGAGVIVLPGVTVGDNAVIGAGSIVTRDVPANVLAVGNPCRVLREIGEHDRAYYFKDRRIDGSAL